MPLPHPRSPGWAVTWASWERLSVWNLALQQRRTTSSLSRRSAQQPLPYPPVAMATSSVMLTGADTVPICGGPLPLQARVQWACVASRGQWQASHSAGQGWGARVKEYVVGNPAGHRP